MRATRLLLLRHRLIRCAAGGSAHECGYPESEVPTRQLSDELAVDGGGHGDDEMLEGLAMNLTVAVSALIEKLAAVEERSAIEVADDLFRD